MRDKDGLRGLFGSPLKLDGRLLPFGIAAFAAGRASWTCLSRRLFSLRHLPLFAVRCWGALLLLNRWRRRHGGGIKNAVELTHGHLASPFQRQRKRPMPAWRAGHSRWR